MQLELAILIVYKQSSSARYAPSHSVEDERSQWPVPARDRLEQPAQLAPEMVRAITYTNAVRLFGAGAADFWPQ